MHFPRELYAKNIHKEVGESMRKIFVMGLALLIGFAFVTGAFAQSTTEKATQAATDTAQEKAKVSGEALKTKAKEAVGEKTAPAPDQAAPAPEKKVEKKDIVKVKGKHAKGEVTVVDMAAKTITIKGKTGDMTFDVANAKMKAEPKVGDKVFVRYAEADGKMIAKYVVAKKKHHRGQKEAAKKDAAPAEKPAAPQPATAPAPVK
jgi:hypothetical protein